MDPAEIKAMDRAMLQRWESGELEQSIKGDHPKVKVRVGRYRERGVVGPGRAVDWEKFAQVDPPEMRNRGAAPPRQSNTKSNTSAIQDIAPSNTSSNTPPPQRIAPSNTPAISPEDLAVVREVVKWWKGREAPSPARSGERRAVTFRLPVDLLEALKAAAQREGVSQAELVCKALEGWL